MKDASRALAAIPALASLLAAAPAPSLPIDVGARSEPGRGERSDPLLDAFRSGIPGHAWHALRRLSRRQDPHPRPLPEESDVGVGGFGDPRPITGLEGTLLWGEGDLELIDNPVLGGRLEWRWDRFSFALVDFEGYDKLPYLQPIQSYTRNVDPFTGRPRLTGATGPCTTGFANTLTAQRNAMTLEAVGTDPVCLKGGGGAGFPDESRFRQAPDLNGDGIPDSGLLRDLVGPGGVLVVNGGFPDGIPESIDLNGDGIPDDVDGDGQPDFYGFGGAAPPGSLPNAPYHQSANQQFFATVCSATVGIAPQLEPGACAFDIFAAPAPILQTGGFQNFIFSEALSAFFAGEPALGLNRFIDLAVQTSIGGGVGGDQGAYPIRMLNRNTQVILDPALLPPAYASRRVGAFGDGVNTFTNRESFNRTPTCLYPSSPSGPLNPNPSCVPDVVQDPIDWLSLDSTLTNQQRALIGCGPFFGTRCDSSAREPDLLNPTQDGQFGSGGGIDFVNMEASVLVQSWAGLEGTYTWGLNGRRPGERWLTTPKHLVQPGTIGRNGAGDYVSFDGGPVATRYIPATGQTAVLPGARGLASADALARAGLSRDTPIFTLAADESSLTALFEPGYDPIVDGCVLGTRVGGIPVVGVEVGTGAAVDLSHCGPSSSSVPGQVINGSSTRFRQTQVGAPVIPTTALRGGASPLVAANNEVVLDAERVRMIDGSQTLYHPLAGCFADPAGAGAGMLCGDLAPTSVGLSAVERDYEAEFLAGLRGTDSATDRIASVFRTEMAAVSWNILQLLIVTSCSGDTDGRLDDPQRAQARLARRECFSPGTDPDTGLQRQWMSDRCGFAAPYLCRNVQGFLDLAGVGSRQIQRGGNGRFGRRTFAWHSGLDLQFRTDVGIRVVTGRVKTRGAQPRRWPVEVEVYGSPSVDVARLDLASLRFGPGGAPPVHDLGDRRARGWHLVDRNGDGFEDLVAHFDSRRADLARDEAAACLAGDLDGGPFLACSEIEVEVYRSRARRPAGAALRLGPRGPGAAGD